MTLFIKQSVTCTCNDNNICLLDMVKVDRCIVLRIQVYVYVRYGMWFGKLENGGLNFVLDAEGGM